MSKDGQPVATDGPSDEPAEQLELTPREIAIARGDDVATDEPEVNEVLDAEIADDDAYEDEPAVETAAGDAPWYDDFTVEVAGVHGISEDDLAALGSRQAFTGLLKYLSRFDQEAPAEPATPALARQVTPAAPEATVEHDADSPTDKDGLINVQYYRDHDYDDATIKGWESARKTQDAQTAVTKQLASYQQQQAEAANAQHLNAVHDALDAMNPEFYGVSKNDEGYQRLGPEEGVRRQKVYDKARILQQAYAQEKQPVPSLNELLSQAESLTFGRELAAAKGTADTQDMTQRIARQSRKRRPVANNAGAKGGLRSPDEDPYSTEAISKKLAGKWREIEDANGSR